MQKDETWRIKKIDVNYVNNWSIEIDIIDLYHFFVLWANPRVAGVWVTTRCYFIDRFSYSLLTCFQNGLSPFLPPGFCLLTIVKHVTQVTSHILLLVLQMTDTMLRVLHYDGQLSFTWLLYEGQISSDIHVTSRYLKWLIIIFISLYIVCKHQTCVSS